jgi:serine/threonine protein kinase
MEEELGNNEEVKADADVSVDADRIAPSLAPCPSGPSASPAPAVPALAVQIAASPSIWTQGSDATASASGLPTSRSNGSSDGGGNTHSPTDLGGAPSPFMPTPGASSSSSSSAAAAAAAAAPVPHSMFAPPTSVAVLRRTGVFASDYERGRGLGEGSYATVYLVTSRVTGERFACKDVNRTAAAVMGAGGGRQGHDPLLEEIEILKRLHHPNVVRFVDAYEEDIPVLIPRPGGAARSAAAAAAAAAGRRGGPAPAPVLVPSVERHLYMILEYVNGGEVFDKILHKARFGEGHARQLFRQVLKGVAYLHSKGVCHRDLKPENMLLHKYQLAAAAAAGAKAGAGAGAQRTAASSAAPSSSASQWRYTCKIADFGMSRVIAATGGPSSSSSSQAVQGSARVLHLDGSDFSDLPHPHPHPHLSNGGSQPGLAVLDAAVAMLPQSQLPAAEDPLPAGPSSSSSSSSAAGAPPHLARAKSIVGTPQYIPPEIYLRWKARDMNTDGRADECRRERAERVVRLARLRLRQERREAAAVRRREAQQLAVLGARGAQLGRSASWMGQEGPAAKRARPAAAAAAAAVGDYNFEGRYVDSMAVGEMPLDDEVDDGEEGGAPAVGDGGDGSGAEHTYREEEEDGDDDGGDDKDGGEEGVLPAPDETQVAETQLHLWDGAEVDLGTGTPGGAGDDRVPRCTAADILLSFLPDDVADEYLDEEVEAFLARWSARHGVERPASAGPLFPSLRGTHGPLRPRTQLDVRAPRVRLEDLRAVDKVVREGYDGFAMDSWSLGVILFVLLSGRNMFVAEGEWGEEGEVDEAGAARPTELQQLLGCMTNFASDDWDGVSEEARDLILSLCRVNPSHRLTPWQALQHPWMLGKRLGEVPHPDTLPRTARRRSGAVVGAGGGRRWTAAAAAAAAAANPFVPSSSGAGVAASQAPEACSGPSQSQAYVGPFDTLAGGLGGYEDDGDGLRSASMSLCVPAPEAAGLAGALERDEGGGQEDGGGEEEDEDDALVAATNEDALLMAPEAMLIQRHTPANSSSSGSNTMPMSAGRGEKRGRG